MDLVPLDLWKFLEGIYEPLEEALLPKLSEVGGAKHQNTGNSMVKWELNGLNGMYIY